MAPSCRIRQIILSQTLFSHFVFTIYRDIMKESISVFSKCLSPDLALLYLEEIEDSLETIQVAHT